MNKQRYINEFLFFAIGPDEEKGEGVLKWCSGVNMTRFMPLSKGKHGMGPNPAMRGLQLTNVALIELAVSKGASARLFQANDCAAITPTKEAWATELLLITNAPDSFAEEAVPYCIKTLLSKISNACRLEFNIPDKLPGPEELQVFIEALCKKYGS